MRVALVHDWLTGMRGGEWVLEEIASLFPEAPIYTLVHRKGSISESLESHRIHTSFLQRIPGARRHYRRWLPLMPMAIEGFDLRGFDLVVSSSHCVAKGVRPGDDAVHLSYVHTPMRYVWHLYEDYARGRGPIARAGMAAAAHYLRVWDVSSAERVDHFLANSRTVSRRIEQVYRRDAEVIHPPIDTDFFTPAEAASPRGGAGETHLGLAGERAAPGDYYLLVSALVPYKRIDLAIEAFAGSGRRLVIIGSGPEEGRLRRMAGLEVEFAGWRSREGLRDLYRGARALIFPGLEDFGMAPVESLACGTPVVAYGAGGVTESVTGPVVGPDGPTGEMAGVGRIPTGVFFHPQTSTALARAVRERERMEFEPGRLRARAMEFSRARFRGRMTEAVRRLTGHTFDPGVEEPCKDTRAS